MFLKSPFRIAKFQEIVDGEMPLPPFPIVTQWGTWIEAASYCTQRLKLIVQIVNDLGSEEAEMMLKFFNTRGTQDFIFNKFNFY